MCYNNINVKVTVASSGSNWRENKSSEGLFTRTADGCVLKYFLDGDECVLTVQNATVTQERRGGQNVYISFEPDKRSRCIIGSGGLSGGFEIFTRKLQTLYGKGGFRLSLEYTNGSDEELIKLTLSAIYKNNCTNEKSTN